MRRTIFAGLYLLIYTGTVWAQEAGTDQPAQETITVPKAELEELKATVSKIKQELQEVKDKQATPPATDIGAAKDTGTASFFGGKYLTLPDISFNAQSKGYISSDKRDSGQNSLRLSEAELAIQGFVYPGVKADAFITMSPKEDAAAQVEEAYITWLGPINGLNIYVGDKHVAFDRVNLLHNHSWLYARQPLVLTNLVADESLSGEGAGFSYLIPTGSDLFAQVDLGTWAGAEGPGDTVNAPDSEVIKGPGAGFSNRFNTARLWTGYPVTENGELELGGSWARGAADGAAISGHGYAQLTGVDLTYRYLGEASSRLLLRAEAIQRLEKEKSESRTVTGYYLFGDYRWNKYYDTGILYDWSEFPQDTSLHESAISLILTRYFSEQFYVRLQGVYGSRPHEDSGSNHSYSELWLHIAWGIGPHTHNME